MSNMFVSNGSMEHILQGAPKPRRGRGQAALPSPTSTERWQWGGCSDNVRFGLKKSREFMDSRYRKRSDIKTLIKLHNHNAGRLVSKFCFEWFNTFGPPVLSIMNCLIFHNIKQGIIDKIKKNEDPIEYRGRKRICLEIFTLPHNT